MKKTKKGFNTSIDLRYKSPRNGPELSLVQSFKENFNGIFSEDSFEVKVFEEPYIGNVIPDIVIVFWDEKIFNYWQGSRNYLETQDIKILHHMYLENRFFNLETLKEELGYSGRELEETLERLMEADLIIEEYQTFTPKSSEDIFFVKEIISIEAKIKNWKKAFEQAWLYELFASESYVLLPRSRISSQIARCAEELGVGLIGHNDKETSVVKKPVKRDIPSSYLSWLFNENIGRELYYEDYL
jgi:predicted transcriptional regulator